LDAGATFGSRRPSVYHGQAFLSSAFSQLDEVGCFEREPLPTGSKDNVYLPERPEEKWCPFVFNNIVGSFLDY
jgi:hypothetical protein